MKKHTFISFIICTCLIPFALFAQTAIHHPNPAQNLQQRWDWAMMEAQKFSQAQGYWVGYSIERLMGEQSFIGTFHSNPRESEVVLSKLLFGQKADISRQAKSDGEKIRELAQKTLEILETVVFKDDETVVQKEALYRISQTEASQSLPLLKKIAQSHPILSLRKEAIYRISQRKSTPGVAAFLSEIVFNDSNHSLQKEALYRISQFETGISTSNLIKIAETHPVVSIRKEAVYRLSQRKSSRQAVAAIENIAFEDKDHSIRKEAVYRLAQVDASLGIPSLARIAKSHPEKAIRKAAIYRLGKKKHPEANKVVVELLEGK